MWWHRRDKRTQWEPGKKAGPALPRQWYLISSKLPDCNIGLQLVTPSSVRGYLAPGTLYLRLWFSHSLQSHKKHISEHILQKWEHYSGIDSFYMWISAYVGLWIIVSCSIVYRFSKLYPGPWEGSLCSHQAQLIKQTTYCKPGWDQTPFNLWNWIHNASHCDQVMQKITILRAWHGILMWDQLTFSHFHIPLSSRFKVLNSSTNFSIRKYFPWKQKNLGVAPVLVQIISWPGTLSS